MPNELRRRLREVVDTYYEGSARDASLALGKNANLLGVIFKDPNHVPRVQTLALIAERFHWPLCDVVHWALGLPVDAPRDPQELVTQGLTALGVPLDSQDAAWRLWGLPAPARRPTLPAPRN